MPSPDRPEAGEALCKPIAEKERDSRLRIAFAR